MDEPKEPVEPKEPTEPKEPEEDIKKTPEYIAMKEMLDNQTAELEKLQKQVKDLQVEKEKMALSYGLEDKRQEELDNAWLGFSRYSHNK
nr:MAG TPA: hypothetical protein [Caudoviricetes sp.]